jgi:hypothetical protein
LCKVTLTHSSSIDVETKEIGGSIVTECLFIHLIKTDEISIEPIFCSEGESQAI